MGMSSNDQALTTRPTQKQGAWLTKASGFACADTWETLDDIYYAAFMADGNISFVQLLGIVDVFDQWLSRCCHCKVRQVFHGKGQLIGH